MLKHLLLALIILLAAALASAAQDEPREIYTALAYGDGVFEPELWLANAAEQELRTTAQWTSTELNGVAFLDYLHFECGIDQEEIEAYFNKDWFTGAFINYEGWEQRQACRIGDIMLFEFNMNSEGSPYSMRYWVQPVGRQRVAAIFITLPVDAPDLLDDYAARLFPDAVSCPR